MRRFITYLSLTTQDTYWCNKQTLGTITEPLTYCSTTRALKMQHTKKSHRSLEAVNGVRHLFSRRVGHDAGPDLLHLQTSSGKMRQTGGCRCKIFGAATSRQHVFPCVTGKLYVLHLSASRKRVVRKSPCQEINMPGCGGGTFFVDAPISPPCTTLQGLKTAAAIWAARISLIAECRHK